VAFALWRNPDPDLSSSRFYHQRVHFSVDPHSLKKATNPYLKEGAEHGLPACADLHPNPMSSGDGNRSSRVAADRARRGVVLTLIARSSGWPDRRLLSDGVTVEEVLSSAAAADHRCNGEKAASGHDAGHWSACSNLRDGRAGARCHRLPVTCTGLLVHLVPRERAGRLSSCPVSFSLPNFCSCI
jgi:hypothetical protein